MLTSGGPIYIFGVPRSGITWIRRIVDRHPDVQVLGLVVERYRRAVRRP
jgi:hypothetical protein